MLFLYLLGLLFKLQQKVSLGQRIVIQKVKNEKKKAYKMDISRILRFLVAKQLQKHLEIINLLLVYPK